MSHIRLSPVAIEDESSSSSETTQTSSSGESAYISSLTSESDKEWVTCDEDQNAGQKASLIQDRLHGQSGDDLDHLYSKSI